MNTPKSLGKRAKRLGKRLKLWLGLARPYQRKRADGTDERWQLIRRELDAGDRSLLDIGSNLGVLTELAAGEGLFALGVEPDFRLVRAARRRTRSARSVGFVCAAVDPDSVAALPACDVVLCLSVHHYWVRAFGEEAAWRIMGVLLARARRKLFFEPASVKRKFGAAAPDFEDLDREAIVEYNVKHLESLLAPDQRVRFLGETRCRPREPFRLVFLIERRPAGREDPGAR